LLAPSSHGELCRWHFQNEGQAKWRFEMCRCTFLGPFPLPAPAHMYGLAAARCTQKVYRLLITGSSGKIWCGFGTLVVVVVVVVLIIIISYLYILM
jgi:hypothetical protein